MARAPAASAATMLDVALRMSSTTTVLSCRPAGSNSATVKWTLARITRSARLLLGAPVFHEALDEAGIHLAANEPRILRDLDQERDRRVHPFDHERLERDAPTHDRFFAGVAAHDQLAEQ